MTGSSFPRYRRTLTRARLPLNAFGISFGLSGLAGSWTAAASAHVAPALIGDVLWVVAAAVGAATVVRYAMRSGGWRAVGEDLHHQVLGPFAALVPIIVMLIGARLASVSLVVGQAIVVVALTAAALFAAWFVRNLMSGDHTIDSLHPGYLLPTVAAGLIGGQSAAAVGWRTAALASFGVGMLFWALIGAALVARLTFRPPLPVAITPTLAIFSAPPAVAGNAWFAIDGSRIDQSQRLLLGAFVLLIVLQLLLVPTYVRLPFTLGSWAITFTLAASATYGIRWLVLSEVVGATALVWVILLGATGLIGVIAGASVLLVRRSARPQALRATETSAVA